MIPRFLTLFAAMLIVTGPTLAQQQSQTLPDGYLSTSATHGTGIPFNVNADAKVQWMYDSDQFQFPLSGTIRIDQIYIRPRFAFPTMVGGAVCPNLTVTLGTTTYYAVPVSSFASNMHPGSARVVRSGPWSSGALSGQPGIAAPWLSLGLTTGFEFSRCDGRDLVVQIEKCGTTQVMGVDLDATSGALAHSRMIADLSSCSGAVFTSAGSTVPVIRVDYTILSSSLGSQTLPAGYDSVLANSITDIPFGSTSDIVQQWCYDSSQFESTGPILIQEIYIRPKFFSNATMPGGSFNDVTVTLGTTADINSLGTNMPSNFTSGSAQVVRSGPWAPGPMTGQFPLPAAWVPLGLTSNYLYLPCAGKDFVVEVRKCGTTEVMGQGLEMDFGSTVTTLRGNYTSCSATFANAGGLTCPLIRIDYVPYSGVDWQLNQARATMTVDGVESSGAAPAITTKCTSSSGSASFAAGSDQIGLPFECALTLSPLVALSAGGIATAGGQILNIDLDHPTLGWLNGGAAPVPAPWPGNFTVPFQTPGFPFTLSAQLAVLSPSHVDGFALSQGCQIAVTPGSPLPAGPVGDNVTVAVNLGVGGACLPSIPFFGTSYSQMHVSSNGRVLFGGSDNDATATPAEALGDYPFVGFWTDLNPGPGGVVMSAPAAGLLRVAWNGVPYSGSGSTSSFAIEFDTSTGAITLSGLGGIGTNPFSPFGSNAGKAQFLGISMGNAGATDNGSTIFLPGIGGSSASTTAMIYDYYGGVGPGKCFSLLAGLQTLVFTPAPNGNYTWAAY